MAAVPRSSEFALYHDDSNDRLVGEPTTVSDVMVVKDAVPAVNASIIKPQLGGHAAVLAAVFDFNTDGTISTANFSQVGSLFGNAAGDYSP